MFTKKGRRMAETEASLIPQQLQKSIIGLTNPLIKILSRWGIKPNAVTVAGVITTACAAVIILLGYIRWGGVLILLGGLCDMIDGILARYTHTSTRFGALLDSTIDRYAEFVMFFGIAAYFFFETDYWSLVAVFLALCGSLMVSYTRARAEGLGFEAKIGLMQRAERIVIIGLGALIHPVALKVAIWLVAFFANYTAAQRIMYIYKQDVK
jgi:CDP-diacylglycerol--glycerol-3-phosphate 3-phosphatidyltransferase